MAIIQTLNKSSFIDAFMQSSRKDQFSYEALEAIFDYLEEASDSMVRDIELDIIAICCEWVEMTWQDIATEYGVDLSMCDDDDERMGEVETYLCNHTAFTEVGNGRFVFQQF